MTAAAQEGDAVACDLLTEGAAGLVDAVSAVAERLGMAGGPFEVAWTGGLFQAGAVVLDPLRAALAARLPRAALRPAELPPVLGAGLLALRGAGIAIDESVVGALREGASRLA